MCVHFLLVVLSAAVFWRQDFACQGVLACVPTCGVFQWAPHKLHAWSHVVTCGTAFLLSSWCDHHGSEP